MGKASLLLLFTPPPPRWCGLPPPRMCGEQERERNLLEPSDHSGINALLHWAGTADRGLGLKYLFDIPTGRKRGLATAPYSVQPAVLEKHSTLSMQTLFQLLVDRKRLHRCGVKRHPPAGDQLGQNKKISWKG